MVIIEKIQIGVITMNKSLIVGLIIIAIVIIIIAILIANGNLHFINGNEIILQNNVDEILFNVWWA